jgi:hypothetical protein
MNKLSKLSVDVEVAPRITTHDRWLSALGLRFSAVVVSSAVALIATTAFALGPNVLVNGDFESYPQSSWANNIGGTVTPWVVGAGNQPNVVKVVGNGSYGYLAGPQSDASGVGGSGPRYYLDITNGHNDIYQPFTLKCEGKVVFGGYFSSRCDNDGTAHAGTGNVQLVQGTGTGGTLVATTNTVTLPAGGNAHTDPWKLASSPPVNLPAGTYSFVVKMSDEVNFDEAYVKYETDCDTQGGSSGCAQVTGEARCLPNGGYSYTFNVTNNSGNAISQILLTPEQGSTFTLTPQLTNLTTPLQSGQSTTVTTTIGNIQPGDKVCFFVSLMSEKDACCIVKVCPTIPQCGGTPPPPPTYPTPATSAPPRQMPRGKRRP